MEAVCRTCMGRTADLHYIFYDLKIMERTLPEIITYVSEVKVDENDNLPNYICSVCIELAKSALLFKEQCKKSDATFKEFLSIDNFTEKAPIKTELDNCANDTSNFDICQDQIKLETDAGESRNFAKSKIPEVEIIDSFDPYQCAVCSLRFSFCNQLDEHIKEIHNMFCGDPQSTSDNPEYSDGKPANKKFTCESCHKNFSEKKKLQSHLKKCERKQKHISDESFSEDSNMSSIKMDDDLKEEDFLGSDNLYNDVMKNKKIKTEPEVVLSTTDEFGVAFMDVDDGDNAELDAKSYKKSSKSKKNNLLKKKEKRRKKNEQAESVDNFSEDFYDSTIETFDDSLVKTELPFQCTMCERKFSKEISLNVHMKKHEEQIAKVYKCNQCKREFQRKGHLDNHILSHASEKGFACDMCPKSFARQDSLSLHVANHKGLKKHQCNFCEKGFNVLSTLKDHIRTHTGEKPFLCSICGRGFSQSTNLKEHMRRHQGYKPFKCIHCDQTFVSKGELEAHMRKHSGAHPFVCDVCGGGFTTSSSLVKHKRIHTGERPYQCDFCPMRFTALGTLKNHRRRHTGEKPYKCAFCEKAFAQKNDLVSHTRTHTGERPYICTVCGHSFRQSSALKTHFKIHGLLPEEPIKIERRSITIHDPPLQIEAIQLMSNLMASKECIEDSSSANALTPKSETSH